MANPAWAKESSQPATIRVGYFPNITHAQAMAGLVQGTFQKALGPEVRIDTKVFTAGPSAIEALFADAIDMTYVGPGPAINGHIKSEGALQVVAGACSGGASLVVREDVSIKTPQDFHGKKLATPQLGNTQDIAARFYLKKRGLNSVEKGGDVQILPMANADPLTLFLKKSLDAAWAPEPWATRLVVEGHGRYFLDERDLWQNGRFATTLLLVRKKFLLDHPDWMKKWLAGHVESTQWVKKHPEEARVLVNGEMKRLTTKALSPDVVEQAWNRLDFTWDPIESSLASMANASLELGFLGTKPMDISHLCDLRLLQEVLREKHLAQEKE